MMNSIKEEMIELETIVIAVYDKLHRQQEDFCKMEGLLDNTQKRIDILKRRIEDSDRSK